MFNTHDDHDITKTQSTVLHIILLTPSSIQLHKQIHLTVMLTALQTINVVGIQEFTKALIKSYEQFAYKGIKIHTFGKFIEK